jgi:two-component sensor histidine kinase
MKIRSVFIFLFFILPCFPAFSYQKNNSTFNIQDSLKIIKLLGNADECLRSGSQSCKKNIAAALVIAERINSPYLKTVCYIRLATAERKFRNGLLMQYNKTALANARESNNDSLLTECLLDYAGDCCLIRNTGLALTLKEEALVLQKNTRSEFLKMKCSFATGLYYHTMNDFDAAKENYDQALNIANVLNNARWIAVLKRAVFNSEIHGLKKGPQTAYIFDAYDYFKNTANYVDVAHCLYTTGRAYMLNGNSAKAMEYFTEAAALFYKNNYLIEAADTRITIAELCLADKKQIKKGLVFATEAERLYNAFAYMPGKIKSLIYLGRLYNADQQTGKANSFFSLADSLLGLHPDKLLQFLYFAGIVEKYTAKNQFNLAKDTPVLAFQLQKQLMPGYMIKRFIEKGKINGILSDDEVIDIKKFIRTGDLDTAIWNIKKDLQGFNPITANDHNLDSNYYVAFSKNFEEVEARYKNRIKDDSLKNILSLHKIAQLKIKTQNWQILLIAAIAGAIAVILYLTNRARKKAILQKQTIELLKEEADHRVKNAFGNINKIIRDVKNKTSDTVGMQLLEQRITPLQRLYQLLGKRGHGVVELQPYFETIASSLEASYQQALPVQVVINAPVLIEGEKAATLGLIVNELLTNAFKYAFDAQQAGMISVELIKDDTEKFRLTVKDNGKGMPEQDNKPAGTGLLQVQALAQQLDADFKMHNQNGSVFEFCFF